jgi:hypothetical protein
MTATRANTCMLVGFTLNYKPVLIMISTSDIR